MSKKTTQAPVAHRGYNVENPRKSRLLTVVMSLMLIYTYLPLLWLFVSATKTQGDLFSTFGLWFGHDFALWDNIRETLTYNDGQFVRWFLNTLMYVVLGAGGSVLLSVLAPAVPDWVRHVARCRAREPPLAPALLTAHGA